MTQRFQYDALVEPITTEAPAEDVTVDKWFPGIAIVPASKTIHPHGGTFSGLEPPIDIPFLPIAQVPRGFVIHPEGGLFEPVEPSLFTEPATMSWLRPTENPPDKFRRNPEGGTWQPWEPSLFSEPDTMSWLRPQNIPPDKAPRNPEGGTFAPLEPTQILEPSFASWWRPTETPPDKFKRNPEGGLWQPLEASLFTEPATMSWLRPTETPPDKACRNPEGGLFEPLEPSLVIAQGPAFGFVSDVEVYFPWAMQYQSLTEPVIESANYAIQTWQQNADPVRLPPRVQAESAYPPYQETPAVVVDLSWFVESQNPSLRKPTIPTGPFVVTPDFSAREMAWHQDRPDVQRRKLVQPTGPVTVTPDFSGQEMSWEAQHPSAPIAKPRIQLPGSVSPSQQVFELLTCNFVQPDIVRRRPFNNFPSLFFVSTEVTSQPIEYWFYQQSEPVKVPKRIILGLPAVFEPTLIITIPAPCPDIPGRPDDPGGHFGRPDLGFENVGRGDEASSFFGRPDLGFDHTGKSGDTDDTPRRGDECR